MNFKKSGRGLLNPTREVHVLNGPNLNMLGVLEEAEQKISSAAKSFEDRIKLRFFQTNYEGEMIEYLHALVLRASTRRNLAGVILNPAAWAHTSVALRDAALLLHPIPWVEVHLTNLLEAEEFRHYSFFEDIADYRVLGMGVDGYVEALRWLVAETKKERLDVH